MIHLNLITPEKKEQLKRELQYARARSVIALFGVLFVALVVVLFSSNMILNSRLESLKQEVQRVESQREAENEAPLTKTIRDLNATLSTVSGIQNEYTNWVDFLVAFSNTVPKNVRVDLLDIRKTTGVVQIKGFSLDRDALIAFKQQLEDSGLFTRIVSPISNLIQKEKIEFQFDGTIPSLEESAAANAEAGKKTSSD